MSRAAAARSVVLLAGLMFGVAGSEASSTGVVSAVATASPLEVRLTVKPSTGAVGSKLKAQATVTNLGKERLLGVTARLRVDRPTVDVAGGETITVGKLDGRHSAHVSWTLCPREPGGYVAVAQASGSYANGRAFAAESPGATFTATPSKKTCPSPPGPR